MDLISSIGAICSIILAAIYGTGTIFAEDRYTVQCRGIKFFVILAWYWTILRPGLEE